MDLDFSKTSPSMEIQPCLEPCYSTFQPQRASTPQIVRKISPLNIKISSKVLFSKESKQLKRKRESNSILKENQPPKKILKISDKQQQRNVIDYCQFCKRNGE